MRCRGGRQPSAVGVRRGYRGSAAPGKWFLTSERRYVRGGLFALYVVEIDVVGPVEEDDLLCSLGHGKPATAAVRRFWAELVGSREVQMTVQDMEGYDEVMEKLLSSLPPEQRLAGLAPP